MLAEISCTQHTPNYFNVNFNSRVDSTTFDTNKVYIVDMPLSAKYFCGVPNPQVQFPYNRS